MPQATGLQRHSEDETGVAFSAAAPAAFDWSSIPAPKPYAPGKNQGSSQSCTSQATGYGTFAALGIDISREDMYANTKLSGGGSYLVSPWQWLVAHGYLTLVQHPDPSPETEENMGAPTGASDAQRTKCIGTLSVYSNPTIDQVAAAVQQHAIAIIGIEYTDQGFASWSEPSYSPSFAGPDGHALHCMAPVISPTGKNAVQCQSSWWGDPQPEGGPSQEHLIDADFFANGGVFELLTIDLTNQGDTMPNPNVETMNYNGTIGVFVPAGAAFTLPVLNALFNLDMVEAADGSIATEKTVVDKA